MENTENVRSFVSNDGNTTYYISPPTAEDIRGADWQYSKTYTKCLVEGITTTAEMRDILIRRGIIGPEFEQRSYELTEDLSLKLKLLEEAEDLETKRDRAVDVALAREEVYQWNQRLNGPLANTCESISDDTRLEYLTSCMVKDENDARIWETYDKFLKNKSQDLASKAKFEVMLYLQGLESGFLDNTPEAVAMREVETEIMSRAQEALDSLKEASKEVKALEKEDAPEVPVEEPTTDKAKTKKRTPKKPVK